MLDQVEQVFALEPDLDLDLMRPEQSLNELTARAFAELDRAYRDLDPELVVVQGDTTTAMVGALAAFHRGISVAHVEAGLRTGDLHSPFPEEANRRIIDMVADYLFAPTQRSFDALARERGTAGLYCTGNTVVDALLWASEQLPAEAERDEVLVTVHRRESFGEPAERIFRAVARLADEFPAIRWILPVHRNPRVREPAHRLLGGRANLALLEPLDYLALVRQLRRCRLVLTDSGGIQEEAPTFGKPVLVLRESTERPEGIDAGVARLVGTDEETIVRETSRLLTDREAHAQMSRATNPYGDGNAAARVVEILEQQEPSPFVARGLGFPK
jgi:UDP-N-acetylglucosamine 2-epimerase (non-hydrolysing)